MTDDTHNDETTQNHHPCEDLDYHALYRTLLRSASKLADNDEYEAADELWASAVGVRTELHHCRSLQPDADQGPK